MSLIEKAAARLETTPVTTPMAARAQSSTMLNNGAALLAERAAALNNPHADFEGSARIELDIHRLAEAGIVTPENPRSLIAEEFRVIKRPLLANAAGASAAPIRNANLLMVTSSLPGEGKSFSAINLAMSIAMEVDKSVLLVDGDVARPSIPRVLGIPEHRGLLDVLRDPSLTVGDVVLKTNVERLSYLSAGTASANATELLASEAMGRLLDDLSRRSSDRIIIFDAPPLLVTTEARALATRMGQIVFVVRAEETPQAAIKEALSTIETCPVKLLILNQARNVDKVAYGYEYGYGY